MAVAGPIITPPPVSAPLLLVCAFLDPLSLCRTATACRALNVSSGFDAVWRPLAREAFKELEHRTDNTEWKDCYKRKREWRLTSLWPRVCDPFPLCARPCALADSEAKTVFKDLTAGVRAGL